MVCPEAHRHCSSGTEPGSGPAASRGKARPGRERATDRGRKVRCRRQPHPAREALGGSSRLRPGATTRLGNHPCVRHRRYRRRRRPHACHDEGLPVRRAAVRVRPGGGRRLADPEQHLRAAGRAVTDVGGQRSERDRARREELGRVDHGQRARRQNHRRCAAEQDTHQHPRHRYRSTDGRASGQGGGRPVRQGGRWPGADRQRTGGAEPQGDPPGTGSRRTDQAEQAAQHRARPGRRSADRRGRGGAARDPRQHGQGPQGLRGDRPCRPRAGAVRQAHAAQPDRVPQRPAQRAVRGIPPAAYQPAVRRRRQSAAHHRSPRRARASASSRQTCAVPRSPRRSGSSATSVSPPS